MVWTSSKWGKFWLWSWIWPWRSRSITPQNNRDLNQGLLHLWSKFGDPSLNGSRVIARTSKWLTHTRTHTRTQAMTIPEGQNWPRVKRGCRRILHIWSPKEITDISHSPHLAQDINSSPLDKMADISQTILSGAFSWMKSFVFWLKFHWSLFLKVQLTISQHWFR